MTARQFALAAKTFKHNRLIVRGSENETTWNVRLSWLFESDNFFSARLRSAAKNGDHGAHHREHWYGSPRVQREPRLLQKAGTRCPAYYGSAKRRDHCRNSKRRTQFHGYYSHGDFSLGERTADQDDRRSAKSRALCADRATQLAVARRAQR